MSHKTERIFLPVIHLNSSLTGNIGSFVCLFEHGFLFIGNPLLLFCQMRILPSSCPCWSVRAFRKNSLNLPVFPCDLLVLGKAGGVSDGEGGGQQGLWPPHERCGPVSPAAFVNCASMCGLELKQEAFSKATFCWLRLRLPVYVYWVTFVCSQIKLQAMALIQPHLGATDTA